MLRYYYNCSQTSEAFELPALTKIAIGTGLPLVEAFQKKMLFLLYLYKVTSNVRHFAVSDFQTFKHNGIPCRHIIKVLL
jgi:hypothetical protein